MLRRHGNAIVKRGRTAGGRLEAAAGRAKTCTNVAVLIDTNILV